jgi:hypothetical protein
MCYLDRMCWFLTVVDTITTLYQQLQDDEDLFFVEDKIR